MRGINIRKSAILMAGIILINTVLMDSGMVVYAADSNADVILSGAQQDSSEKAADSSEELSFFDAAEDTEREETCIGDDLLWNTEPDAADSVTQDTEGDKEQESGKESEREAEHDYEQDNAEGYILNDNQTVSGDFILNGGVLDLNGYHLIVEGNFYHKSGTISMNGGELYIKGNYESGFLDGNQTIQMTKASDVMSVSGDMIVGSVVNEKDLLTDGNVYLYGSFKQNIKSEESYQNFSSSGDFTLHLCGTTEQIIEPYNDIYYTKAEQLTVANLTIENTSEEGIGFRESVFVTNKIKDNLCNKTGALAISKDTTFENDIYYGNLVFYTEEASALTKALKVRGNFEILDEGDGALVINAPLEIEGNFINGKSTTIAKAIVVQGDFTNQNNLTVKAECIISGNMINHAGMTVNGNTKIYGDMESKGKLYINRELSVSGNFTSAASAYVDGKLNVSGNMENKASITLHGNLNVSGNFTDYNSLEIYGGKFCCNGDFRFESGYMEMYYNCAEEAYIKVFGNFYAKEKSGFNLFAGTIEVFGDMKMQSNDFYVFPARKTTLKLSGSRKQTVEITDCNISFTNLVYANTSEEGIVILYQINADNVQNITDCKVECSDNCKQLVSGTLSQNTILEGDYVFSAGTLNLKGYTLTIQGSLLQGGGNINLNGGKLVIQGDYIGITQQSTALLTIRNASDFMQVDGNFEINSENDTWEKGTIELKGIVSVNDLHLYNGTSVILSGTEQQKIDVPDSYWWSRLIIENPAGIECKNHINISEYLDTKGSRLNGTLYLNPNAVVSGNEYDGDIVFSGKSEVISNPLHVKGDVRAEKDIILSASLIVDGNYNSKNSLTITTGELICGKDFDVKSLVLSDAEGNIKINGNCRISNAYNHQKGSLEARGDLYIGDLSSYTEYDWTNNRIILSGEGIQKIEVPQGMKLGIVELKNPDRGGVYFNIRRNRILNLTTQNVPVFFLDNNGRNGWTISEDTILDGDLNIAGGTLDLNGHSLTVTGNLYMQDGTLDIHCGKLTVEGDLRFQTVLLNENGYIEETRDALSYFVMNNKEDYVLVGGDFYMQSAYMNAMERGTLEVRGDYNIITGERTNFTIYNGWGFTVLLSGEDMQKINFQNKVINGSVCYTCSNYFDRLQITNTSEEGVTANYKIYVYSELWDPTQKLNLENTLEVSNLSVITSDSIHANVKAYGCDLTHNLQINGDLTCEYSNTQVYRLDGHDLTVNNLQLNGALIPDGGSLRVRNNLTTSSYGYLKMTKENDYVQIKEDFIIGTSQEGTDNLTAGTLEIGGMISQNKAYKNVFAASGTHTTILTGRSGNDIQYVTFKHDTNKFRHLILWRDTEYYGFTPQLDSICASYEIRYKDETAPQKVTGLHSGSISASTVTLSWNAATDNVKVAGYEIYRNQRKIAVTADVFYCDTGLLPEMEYEYYVRAYDQQRNLSEVGDKITVKTLPDTTAPQAPSGLRMTAKSGSAIKLSWMNATDDVGIKGYRIYRDGELAGKVLKDTLFFKDFVPDKAVLYRYTVTAYDAAGNESVPSAAISASAMDPEITDITPDENAVIGGGKAVIRVRYKDFGDSKYRTKLEYSDKKAASGKWISVDDYWGQTRDYYNNVYTDIIWNISDVEQGLYSVRITVSDEDNNTSVKELQYYVDNEGPVPVTGLQADSVNGVVVLSWTPSVSTDTKNYEVYRSTDKEDAVCVAGNLTKCSYKDADVEVGKTYEYRILAKDNFDQCGDYSEAISVAVTVDTEMPVITGVTCNGHVLGKGENVKLRAEDNRKVEKLRLYYRPDDNTVWTLANAGNETADSMGQLIFFFATENLAEGTYEIKAEAEDASGNVSNPYTGTVTVDHTGIARIENLEAEPHADYITLKWKNTEDTDLDYFAVEQKIEGAFECIHKESSRLGYHVTGLMPHTEYIFRVVGYDTVGNRGIESEEIRVTTTEDTEAPVITAFEPSMEEAYNNEIPLLIRAKDNVGISGLKLSYSYDQKNWTEIVQEQADASGNYFRCRFDVSELAEGKIFIAAEVYDAAGNVSSYENEKITREYVIDHTEPDAVSSITAEGAAGHVTVSWKQVSGDNIAYYNVYRSENEDEYYRIYRERLTTLSCVDGNVSPGRIYRYKVQAVDYAGNAGMLSESVSASPKTDNVPPQIGISLNNKQIIGGTVRVYGVVTDDSSVKQIRMEYKSADSTEDNWTEIYRDNVSTMAASYSFDWDISGFRSGSYIIRTISSDVYGNVSEPYIVTVYVDNSAPDAPAVSANAIGYGVELSWQASEAEDFAFYQIYRRLSGEDKFTFVTSTKENVYQDSNLQLKNYIYKIAAVDNIGNEAYSDEITIMPLDMDTVAPQAVCAEIISTAEGRIIRLDASGSKDNVGIEEYIWDMGNGDILHGAVAEYSYLQQGTYYCSLTVMDAAGNTGNQLFAVKVLDSSCAIIQVSVCADVEGIIRMVPNALISVEDSFGMNTTYYADSEGRLEVVLKGGSYKFAAF